MTTYSYELKIPKERVAVLIGKKGEIKKKIEKNTKTKLKVDSKEGDIIVSGENTIDLYATRELIKAIGRGFNPDIAQLLLKQDFSFELVNIADYTRNKNDITRLKGRVIGTGGKSRRYIEMLSESDICVYGKTIGIIGRIENVTLARKAIENLLKGSSHSNVNKWLEMQRKELKRRELLG